jgi:hypothetical protein
MSLPTPIGQAVLWGHDEEHARLGVGTHLDGSQDHRELAAH